MLNSQRHMATMRARQMLRGRKISSRLSLGFEHFSVSEMSAGRVERFLETGSERVSDKVKNQDA